jgi:hypothetical protein
MIKTAMLAVLLVTQLAFARNDSGDYPQGPNPNLTPGETCTHASTYRYPERIPYCDRNVTSDLKRAIIARYDRQLGYRIESMQRSKFKIDHYIPLCMGGSNDASNLWPQHESVYTVTDPLEPILCEKMAQGKLKQADAIDMIREAKNDLSKVSAIISRANAL